MPNLFHLPYEVILAVLEHLSASETARLIESLAALQDHHTKILLDLLCQRLYAGKVLVVSGRSHDRFPEGDVLPLDYFRKQVALWVSGALLHTRPKVLEFRLVRSVKDYSRFYGDLYGLSEFLDECGKGIYGDSLDLGKLLLYIDGNVVIAESPTSLSTSILNVLLSASGPENLRTQFTAVTIKLTHLGDYHVRDWGQLFGRLVKVETLDLTGNALFLPYLHGVDILATQFRWPPNLKSLNLEGNRLRSLSFLFLSTLPDTLEKLLLRRNMLESLGNFDEYFRFAESLPQLQVLDLSENSMLSLVNVLVFKESSAFQRLCVGGCNIDVGHLVAAARRDGYSVEV